MGHRLEHSSWPSQQRMILYHWESKGWLGKLLAVCREDGTAGALCSRKYRGVSSGRELLLLSVCAVAEQCHGLGLSAPEPCSCLPLAQQPLKLSLAEVQELELPCAALPAASCVAHCSSLWLTVA